MEWKTRERVVSSPKDHCFTVSFALLLVNQIYVHSFSNSSSRQINQISLCFDERY